MLIFIWENYTEIKICENFEFEPSFGIYAGSILKNAPCLTGGNCGTWHAYIYVGF